LFGYLVEEGGTNLKKKNGVRLGERGVRILRTGSNQSPPLSNLTMLLTKLHIWPNGWYTYPIIAMSHQVQSPHATLLPLQRGPPSNVTNTMQNCTDFGTKLLCSNSYSNLSSKFHNTTLPGLYKLCLLLANFPVPSSHARQIIRLLVNISFQRRMLLRIHI